MTAGYSGWRRPHMTAGYSDWSRPHMTAGYSDWSRPHMTAGYSGLKVSCICQLDKLAWVSHLRAAWIFRPLQSSSDSLISPGQAFVWLVGLDRLCNNHCTESELYDLLKTCLDRVAFCGCIFADFFMCPQPLPNDIRSRTLTVQLTNFRGENHKQVF